MTRPGHRRWRVAGSSMPAVIVQPVNAGDVMTAVRFAVDNEMTVAVRGGATAYRASGPMTTVW
jgi:FAD/FMN-containing dehydrogenase